MNSPVMNTSTIAKMNKLIPLLLSALILHSCGPKSNQHQTQAMDQNHLFLLGTYTEQPEDGLNLLAFHPEAGEIEVLHVASDIDNPSFVTANAAQNLVFSTEETNSEQGGKVTSFKLDKATNTLEKINSVFTQGGSPCHISLDPTERFLVVSNYSGGNITVIPVDQQGKLSEEIQVIQHEGSSANPSRQKAPHVHSAVFHPEENRVFVADLGTDKVYLYDLTDDATAPLKPATPDAFSVEAGAGPRHILFNEAGDRFYLIHELTAEVGVYAYEQGQISHVETHALTPEGFTGEVGAAEVRISPDGKYLYASNRGDANTLTVFAIDATTGRLREVQHVSSEGIAPRNFAITADGKFLLCGNQNSDEIVVFDRDQENGTISRSSITVAVSKPVYFYSLD
jgi:6-phosphogluconolactonase